MKSNYVVTLAVLITLGLISLRSICHSSQYLYAAETTHATDAEVCESKLDLLDRVFDSRREARKNFTKTSKARGPKNLYDPYEPEAICISDERFGKTPRYAAFGDGPKFVCGVDLVAVQQVNKNETQNSGNQSCLVYSVGSNNDIAFEKAVKTHIGCEIHTFDPTLTTKFIGDKYATFHPWGLGSDGKKSVVGNTEFDEKSLNTIKTALGHQNRKIDILKIDCEGCEWRAMPEVFMHIANGTLDVDQIQLEVHGANHPTSQVESFFEFADKAKMRIFHKERNHWGCAGYHCLEFAFISEDFLRRANAVYVC